MKDEGGWPRRRLPHNLTIIYQLGGAKMKNRDAAEILQQANVTWSELTADIMHPARAQEVFNLAQWTYDGRVRLDGTTVLEHAVEVAQFVIEHGGNEEAAIIALLHDALEESNLSCTTINYNIEVVTNKAVLSAVRVLTKPNSDSVCPIHKVKAELTYILSLISVFPLRHDLMLIKVADITSNLRTVNALGTSRWLRYTSTALLYHEIVLSLSPSLAAELYCAIMSAMNMILEGNRENEFNDSYAQNGSASMDATFARQPV